MPNPLCRLFPVLLVAGSLLLTAGCDLLGGEGDEAPPKDFTLIASVGGDTDGLWRFDPRTLEPTPVVETQNRTPIGVASSPDHERWYTAWGRGNRFEGTDRKVLAILDPTSGRIMKQTSTPGSFRGRAPLLYEPVNDHLVIFDLDGSAQFFDAATLELTHELPVGYLEGAAVAPEREKTYFGVDTESGAQIRVYDPTEAEITRTISLPGILGLSDVALSPDERYLFATTWSSLGPPGHFYMVDVESGEVLFEGQVGSYAELAVTPDGRHVFIDCPAGGMLEHIPTNQLLRFDTQQRELEVFINGGEELGLGYEGLMADKITMLPNGEAFVVRDPSAARIRLDDGEQGIPSLFVVDAETAEVLATYTPERDDRGLVENYILHLGIETVPKQ